MADDRRPDQAPGDSSDDLLWRTALADRKADDPERSGRWSVDDLAAYRADRLADTRRAELEDDLAASAALRARLARAAGVEGAPVDIEGSRVDETARARALAAFDESFATAPGSRPEERGAGRVLAWRPRGVRSWAGASSAIAALAALLILAVVWTRDPAGLPPDLAFHVEARGQAEIRGEQVPGVLAPDDDGLPRTDPIVAAVDTRVTLEVSPSRSVDGVSFALYRRPAGSERPVPLSLPASSLVVDRGAARVEAPARLLFGDTPGEGVLYVVARADVRAGDDPSRLDAPPERTIDDLVADVSADRIRVVGVPYRLLPSAAR